MLNKLLQNQVQKYLGGLDDLPENLTNLLEAISASYDHKEKDRKLLERSVEISSIEMIELNTSLRETNRELSNLFNTIDEVLFSVDIKLYKVTQMSSACKKVYGYEPADFFSDGELWSKVIHTDDKYLLEDMYTRLHSGKEVRNQYRIIHKEGDPRWIENTVIPTLDEQGLLARLDGVTRDITEKKKAEAEILELNESLERKVKERTAELETANKELEAFSYSVSHDLRAPLRIINGYGKMLLKNNLDKFDTQGKEDLQTIMSNATRMGNLIDDLLDFSRLGRTPLAKRKVNMTEIVREAVDEIKGSTGSAAEISIQDFEDTNCDPVLMKQVWTNLISNAVKYSGEKEAPLIEIGSTDLNGQQTYYIKDNGAGFDMQYADKLFAVFQRLHKVTEYEGTGVGLALVQRIITRHGGKIWADAKENEGATFYFTLSN